VTLIKQAASLTERENRLAHYFALFWGLGLLLGYLATSGAKSDVIFVFGDPNFLQMRRNFAPILLSFRVLTRDRQTDDRRDDRCIRLLHLHCASRISNRTMPFYRSSQCHVAVWLISLPTVSMFDKDGSRAKRSSIKLMNQSVIYLLCEHIEQ